jgi:hypothetical protein
MSRVAQSKQKIIAVTTAAVVAAAVGVGAWAYTDNQSNQQASKVPTTTIKTKAGPHKSTQISYQGQDGRDALSLLKQHAEVKTKHYSFGDQVVSINGVSGNGPKYWTFYVNGKM